MSSGSFKNNVAYNLFSSLALNKPQWLICQTQPTNQSLNGNSLKLEDHLVAISHLLKVMSTYTYIRHGLLLTS